MLKPHLFHSTFLSRIFKDTLLTFFVYIVITYGGSSWHTKTFNFIHNFNVFFTLLSCVSVNTCTLRHNHVHILYFTSSSPQFMSFVAIQKYLELVLFSSLPVLSVIYTRHLIYSLSSFSHSCFLMSRAMYFV